MSEAIILNNAYKHFGKGLNPVWRRFTRLGFEGDGNGANGHMNGRPTVVAVDRVSFSVCAASSAPGPSVPGRASWKT